LCLIDKHKREIEKYCYNCHKYYIKDGESMDEKIELTPEQLAEVQAFLQKNDITANMAVKREYNFKGDKAKVFKRANETAISKSSTRRSVYGLLLSKKM